MSVRSLVAEAQRPESNGHTPQCVEFGHELVARLPPETPFHACLDGVNLTDSHAEDVAEAGDVTAAGPSATCVRIRSVSQMAGKVRLCAFTLIRRSARATTAASS